MLRAAAAALICSLSAVVAVGLAGCGLPDRETAPLVYEPTAAAPLFRSRPVVAVGSVVDARAEPPQQLGSIAGVLGFRDEALLAEPPVPHAVRAAFSGALMARGLLAPMGRQRFDLAVRIVRLDAVERWKRRAAADLVVALLRHDTGRIVYRTEVGSVGTGAGPYSLDTAAYVPVADVAEMAQGVMNRAIERALDSPGFRAALRD